MTASDMDGLIQTKQLLNLLCIVVITLLYMYSVYFIRAGCDQLHPDKKHYLYICFAPVIELSMAI